VSTEHDRNRVADHDRDQVNSLAKGLGVMELLAAHPSGLTLTEAAEHAGMTRAGARRFLLTLVRAGYATQDGRRFSLSPRLLSVARTWLDGSTLWSFALEPMRAVASAFKESCSAAVLSGEDVVYVQRVAGERITSVALRVGTRLPAYCTSMGRVLLAGLDPAEVSAILKRTEIRKNTPKTVTDRAELTKIVAEVARAGYVVVDEELETGLRSIAVPIRDRQGRTAAAVNVSTQSARFTIREMERQILPLLKDAARQIEDYLAMQ
jgi:IclR family transcriptional regulator, pca regulon regulatory protein